MDAIRLPGLMQSLRYGALALGLAVLGGCAVYEPAPLLAADGTVVYPYAPAVVAPPVVVPAPYYVGPPVSVDFWFSHGYHRGWGGYHHYHGHPGFHGGFHGGRH